MLTDRPFLAGSTGPVQRVSANLLGTSQTWSGATFNIGPAGTSDVVSGKGQTISLPSGAVFLAQAAGHRRQRRPAQPDVHRQLQRRDDGDLHSVDERLAYAAELHGRVARCSPCLTAISPMGPKDNRTFYLYGYSFALNPAKTVQSITLPNQANVKMLAIDLLP